MSYMQYVHWPTSQKNTISNSEGLGIFFIKKGDWILAKIVIHSKIDL